MYYKVQVGGRKMNRELFNYDEQSHKGTYKGFPIPSVTQLLDILFPLSSDIPTDRLEKASDRGTTIHAQIENINKLLMAKVEMPNNYQYANETLDYMAILNAYNLIPLRCEELVFLLDENDEPICFGHYDLVLGAQKNNEPFTDQMAYMFDIKTTSLFAKEKTALQTHAYRVAFNQNSQYLKLSPQTYGLWLRDGVKIIPLKQQSDEYIINLFKQLRGVWNETKN